MKGSDQLLGEVCVLVNCLGGLSPPRRLTDQLNFENIDWAVKSKGKQMNKNLPTMCKVRKVDSLRNRFAVISQIGGV